MADDMNVDIKPFLRRITVLPNVLSKGDTIIAAAERHGLLTGRILNVGSKNVRIGNNSINLDIKPGAAVDVVGDAHELTHYFEKEAFDTVILSAVLQYCRDPMQVIQQVHDVLKPGGWLVLDAPFLQPYCPDGLDLWRFSADGLRSLCERHFEIVELNPSITTGSSLGFIIQRVASNSKNRLRSLMMGWMATLFVYPLRLARGSDTDTAGAFLLVARKPTVQPVAA